MPPKKFSQFVRQGGQRRYMFSQGVIQRRPALAGIVLEVISTWSHSEHKLIGILGAVLKSQHVVVTEMLQAVQNQNAKHAAILAAVRAHKPNDFPLFDAAFETLRDSRETRNRFAHHLWGISEDLPDELLLVDPKHVLSVQAKRKENQNVTIDHNKITVYSENDLNEALQDAIRAYRVTQQLHALVVRPIGDSTRTWLKSEPLIQLELKNRSQKTSRKAGPP